MRLDFAPTRCRAVRGRSGPAGRGSRARANLQPDQRGEIEKIIKEYLLTHPELMQDVMNELEKRQATAEAEKHRAAVKENSAAIFASPRQVTLGNPQGDVTVVEFFDYNCGYCKRAMADMIELMKTDAKLKFVLKEFPVLGEGSVQAAQVAAAVRMQDKTRQEISRIPSEAARRPRPGGQDARARRRQGNRPRRRPHREGHGGRRGEGDDRGELQARRGARPQRHAELRGRAPMSSSARSAPIRSRKRSTPRAAARRRADGASRPPLTADLAGPAAG